MAILYQTKFFISIKFQIKIFLYIIDITYHFFSKDLTIDSAK